MFILDQLYQYIFFSTRLLLYISIIKPKTQIYLILFKK